MFLDLFLPEDIYSLKRLQEKLTEKWSTRRFPQGALAGRPADHYL